MGCFVCIRGIDSDQTDYWWAVLFIPGVVGVAFPRVRGFLDSDLPDCWWAVLFLPGYRVW